MLNKCKFYVHKLTAIPKYINPSKMILLTILYFTYCKII